ncbi:MAG TPA: tetratricopeptide repeat protein, partial [Polyangiaceae bacterium]|nr:tetratricopeptide repeat protein [Polyangiaceae bacterium]
TLICDVLTDWGELEQDRGQFIRARELYDAAIGALPESGDARARARTLGGLGLLHHSQGRLEDAWQAYSLALDFARRADDRRREATLYKDLGSLRLQQGRLDEAKDFYARARALLEELADPLLVGAVDANLAILAQEQSELQDARSLFERAERRLNRHGARLLSAHVRGYAGGLLHELGELDEAALHYEQASAVLREFGDVRNEGLFSAFLGACEAARGRKEAAAEALARAERLLLEVGDPGLFETLDLCRAQVTLARARSLAAEGDTAQSHAARAEVARLAETERERHARSSPQLSDDARLALRLLEAAIAQDAWVFDLERGELRPPQGDAIELSARPQLLRVVRALVEARLATPGVALNQEQLIAVGWPGERMQSAAAANRVKVALSTLRSAGLRDLLVRRAGGYLLDPGVPLLAHGPLARELAQDVQLPERSRR